MGNCKSSIKARERQPRSPSTESTLAVQTPCKSPVNAARLVTPNDSSPSHRGETSLNATARPRQTQPPPPPQQGLVILVQSPRLGQDHHHDPHHDPHYDHPMNNTSMTQTPFVQSVFAYPESPQLQGPRHGEDNISSRQRTGSLPPPETPLSTMIYIATPQSAHIFPQITSDLLAQLQWTAMPVARTHTQSPRKAGAEAEDGVPMQLIGIDEEESRLATTNDEDDANFAMARRNASIQHVLSWMDTGSTGMTREDSDLGRNCSSMVDECAI